MPVGSPIEIYTTVLAWHLFTSFWALLSQTGLVLIPFGWMVFVNMIESRKNASKMDVGVRAFRRSEAEVYTAAFVAFIFAVPTVNININAVHYTNSSCEVSAGGQLDRGSAKISFGATRTTYDEAVGAPIIASLEGGRPKMPVVWYLVTRYMRAIPEALKHALPCNPDLRLMATEISNSQVTAPALRDELGMFQRDCWRPSVSRFLRDKPPTQNTGIEDINADISWAGSQFFLTTPGYYDIYRASELLTSFRYDPVRDESRVSSEHAQGRGMPYCQEWWDSSSEGLRALLLEDTGLDSNVNVRYWLNRAFGSSNSREARDALLYEILNTDVKLQSNKIHNAYPRDGSGGALNSVQDTLRSGATTLGLVAASHALSTTIYTIKQAAPIFQAIIIMFVVIMLPAMLMISGFEIKTAVTFMFLLASFHFWSFIFALVHWLDTSLWVGMLGNTGGRFGQLGWGAALTDNSVASMMLVFNFVIGALYLALPTMLSVLMTVAGQNLGRGLSDSVSGQTQGIGGEGGKGVGLAKKAATKGKG